MVGLEGGLDRSEEVLLVEKLSLGGYLISMLFGYEIVLKLEETRQTLTDQHSGLKLIKVLGVVDLKDRVTVFQVLPDWPSCSHKGIIGLLGGVGGLDAEVADHEGWVKLTLCRTLSNRLGVSLLVLGKGRNLTAEDPRPLIWGQVPALL